METSTWRCAHGKDHHLAEHCDCHVVSFEKYKANQIARRRKEALKQLLKEADELIGQNDKDA